MAAASCVVVPLVGKPLRIPGTTTWTNAMGAGKVAIVTDPLGAHDYMEQAASGFCVDMVIRTRSASVSGESWRTANSGGASGKPTAGRIAVAIDQSPSSLTFLIINRVTPKKKKTTSSRMWGRMSLV